MIIGMMTWPEKGQRSFMSDLALLFPFLFSLALLSLAFEFLSATAALLVLLSGSGTVAGLGRAKPKTRLVNERHPTLYVNCFHFDVAKVCHWRLRAVFGIPFLRVRFPRWHVVLDNALVQDVFAELELGREFGERVTSRCDVIEPSKEDEVGRDGALCPHFSGKVPRCEALVTRAIQDGIRMGSQRRDKFPRLRKKTSQHCNVTLLEPVCQRNCILHAELVSEIHNTNVYPIHLLPLIVQDQRQVAERTF